MKKAFLIALLITVSSLFSKVFADSNNSYLEKINAIPDFTQINDALPDKGRNLCVPVSVSNYIMWLSANGYPHLTNGKSQVEVIKELSILMNAQEGKGIGAGQLMKGLRTFIENKGYKIESLSYQGRKNKYQKRPDLHYAKYALKENCGVFLSIGWYKYTNEYGQNIYEKNGGHNVTLVGFVNNDNDNGTKLLVIHDPSSRSGYTFQNNFIEPTLLKSGTLRPYKNKKYSGLPTKAAGFYKLGGDLKVNKRKGDIGIIDGMVILRMQKPDF